MQLLDELFKFFANSPGNLVYILAVAFTLIGALQGAISQWRISDYPQSRRLIFGLSLLLGLQLLLFLISGLMGQNLIQGSALLPVFDRTVLILSLTWIIWLWAFPEPSRSGDAATVLLSLLALAGALFGSVAYSASNPAGGSFNLSSQSWYWNLAGILILGLGLVLIFFRKPVNWGTGLAQIALILAGFIWEMITPAESGDFSGSIRFFTLAALPILFTLPTRFAAVSGQQPVRKVLPVAESSLEKDSPAMEGSQKDRVRERRRYSSDPKTLQSLLALAAETDPDKVNQDIARSVAQSLLVDLCYLIYIGEDRNSMDIAAGYDLIREETLPGGLLNKDAVPMLSNAILKGRSLRLPASSTSTDLKGLAEVFSLQNAGNLLTVPILSDKGSLGSILLLSPYSNRVWTAEDQTFLTNIVASLVPILERTRHTAVVENEYKLDRVKASEAIEQAQNLKITNDNLSGQLSELKVQLEDALAEASRLKTLAEQASQSPDEQRFTAGLAAIPAAETSLEKTQLEEELHTTLAEMAGLQNQLAESNSRLMALGNKIGDKNNSDEREVIASISQELRQPMSSIIGYADLLLGESVGILGALQRKFVERIRTSTERIGSLVDDLIQITTFETGLVAAKSEPVDLNSIIDNAMAYTASQMREKNITLRIDIPENLHPMDADRDALQQILIHLLQNAGAATPVEGSVTLRVRMQTEADRENVMIQVTDTGGGIPAEDLPRVFSRLYRAENALIQGVGDTGVGLSIAKALTEAQGGIIRVDTEMGKGSTFTVTLPVKLTSPGRIPQEV